MKRLLRKIVSLIDDQNLYPRGHVFLDKIVLAHVSKSLNVAQSIKALIDAGFPEEAFGMSRTMVEGRFQPKIPAQDKIVFHDF